MQHQDTAQVDCVPVQSQTTSRALPPGWWQRLSGEFSKPYMADLKQFLRQEIDQGKVIYPATDEIFAALNRTDFEQVKVVVLGQDPYHGPGQAHGLCFSVKPGVPAPPSLVNIFKELQSDLGIDPPPHGYLLDWADQGVLLLNSVLTVERGKAGAHQNKGWERFTDAVIYCLAEERENLVFVLWGAYAQKKGAFIDPQRHLVLKSPHPSPLSAHRGFFGSKPFSKINNYLAATDNLVVDWQLGEVQP